MDSVFATRLINRFPSVCKTNDVICVETAAVRFPSTYLKVNLAWVWFWQLTAARSAVPTSTRTGARTQMGRDGGRRARGDRVVHTKINYLIEDQVQSDSSHRDSIARMCLLRVSPR